MSIKSANLLTLLLLLFLLILYRQKSLSLYPPTDMYFMCELLSVMEVLNFINPRLIRSNLQYFLGSLSLKLCE